AVLGPNPSVRTLNLESGQISDPAAGSLAFYALEGDLPISSSSNPSPCFVQEYIEVDGDTDPASGGLCLTEVLNAAPENQNNPSGNIFTSTINTQSAPPGAQGCTRGAERCCSESGSTVCGAAGVDIDRFNISSGLKPGGTAIRFQYAS